MDILHGKAEDVHHPVLWGFLMRLARQGSLVAIIGGPPRRTISRLRFRCPGPRPLCDRDHGRFGLEGLSWDEQRLADHDTALVVKQVGLFIAADETRIGNGLSRRPLGPCEDVEQ